ncbi:histone-lysine N-methyltransferase SETMAR-like [Plutella xylostella]|uniref:histone-lysine N-methyltransferase SETMAR-like n=1 Tax=Plutella xylostella TaxID=51655 RepID=UPI0020323210|nr:histone-lysine N-methyltransferase SETMAR-like [Plutella xylostella]
MEQIEQRAVIKFLTKQGKSPKMIMEEMEAVYGTQCPSKTMIYKWNGLFKHGRESIEDDPRSGRPVEVTTSDIVEKIEKLVVEDARLKKKQLSALTGVSETTILRILHDHLGMTKVSARWVPRMLTPVQRKQRVDASKHFLELCGEEPAAVLDRIVTGDETWVHHYEPESKQESMQWHKKGTPPPKKFKVSESVGKIMATVFWDTEGILLIDYKEKGVNITGTYYASLLQKLKEAIKEKRRGKWSRGVLLLHDNAPVHKCHTATAALFNCGYESLIHPPYSPDLAPSDYYLFPKLKKELREIMCGAVE